MVGEVLSSINPDVPEVDGALPDVILNPVIWPEIPTRLGGLAMSGFGEIADNLEASPQLEDQEALTRWRPSVRWYELPAWMDTPLEVWQDGILENYLNLAARVPSMPVASLDFPLGIEVLNMGLPLEVPAGYLPAHTQQEIIIDEPTDTSI